MLIMTNTFISTFIPQVKPVVKTFNYQGDLPPVNYFDPLKLNSERNFKEERVKYWREAELQHGRAAMLGAIVLPCLELSNPGLLSINYLYNIDILMQSPFWSIILFYEFIRMSTGWENPFSKNGKAFSLKKNYQPGNLFGYEKNNVSTTLYNNELSHGRLAMLACAHIISVEALTSKGIF